ncbi:PilN domain-containing protein [Pseudacidovorax intermedius]|uniref:Fimbrial protein n=1 Tax=Pseudacidovorax intermedius TaxID=433924 RepID=A0A147GT35_9BURK|nr:PilN domain-containing protein [Pseudacidovorax intermedius]KTT20663.1 fimbrial protein [Pseudacidovorax intermedius]
MILINLLPHREAARKRRKENFYASLGAAALAGGLLAGIAFLYLQALMLEQETRNSLLTTENQKLDAEIKEIATLQGEIASLRARQKSVEDLQADRNLPVHLLNELVRQMPDGVYLTSMKQENQTVTLQGAAQSNERVSELLRNLANSSPWLTKPELVEITAGTVALSPRDQRRVANFTLRVAVRRPVEAQKPAAGAPAATTTAPAAAPRG